MKKQNLENIHDTIKMMYYTNNNGGIHTLLSFIDSIPLIECSSKKIGWCIWLAKRKKC